MTKRALLVGITDYDTNLPQIKGSINDITRWKLLLPLFDFDNKLLFSISVVESVTTILLH